MARKSFALLLVLLILLLSAAAQVFAQGDACTSPANEIVAENCLTGNPPSDWEVSGDGDDSIQGYATDISVNQGQTVSFKIDTTYPNYRIDIYRLGYYNGDGARKVATIDDADTTSTDQPACLTESSTGLIDCGNWSVSASWAVPANAVSGIYIARPVSLSNDGASHIVFIVRDDDGNSDILFQTADTTWQAYNSYGGNSLYVGSPAGRAYKVSYNRPFNTRLNAGGEDWLFNAEYPMLRWIERNGYDVSYFTGVDSHRIGTEIAEHKIFLSVGHDEFWSREQRDFVEDARDAGVDLAFFSGNDVFWKIRYEDSIAADGTPFRTVVCYKETNGTADPSNDWTGTWRDPGSPTNPVSAAKQEVTLPENALTGQLFTVNSGTATLRVPAADGRMRFWRNTPVFTQSNGGTATLGADTIGYEWNEVIDDAPEPYLAGAGLVRPAGLFTVSTTVVNVPQRITNYGTSYGPGVATHALSLYRSGTGANSALVFGAGTIQWSWGLDTTHDRFGGSQAENVPMQQATVNLFADMGVQPGSLQANLDPAQQTQDTTAPTSTIANPLNNATVNQNSQITISGTASDSGGVDFPGQVAGVEIGISPSNNLGSTIWRRTTGRANWTYNWTPNQPGDYTIRTRAVDDSGNLEAPSAGITVTVGQLPVTCPCSIYAPNFVPPLSNDTGAVELGVKFQSSENGFITAIRFYQGPNNPGPHSGRLWTTSGGQPLATVNFPAQGGTGWRQATLSNPLAITANTTYIVSYHAPNGGYAFQVNGLASAIVSPPLRVLASGENGGNGVFTYGPPGSFPTTTFNASNYFVDVVFETEAGPDTTPPLVTSLSPINNASNVSRTANITATFNEAMNAGTINGTTFQLKDPADNVIPAAVSYNAASFTATLNPSSSLAYSTTYTVSVVGGATGLKDVAGNALAATSTWSFTTEAEPPSTAPGGPILVLESADNPFTRYYTEILRAEGLNAFALRDISTANATNLAQHDVIILGEMDLTTAQVTLLTDWVNAGGNLIAMRPDGDLAALLGLSPVGGAPLAEGYLLVNTASAPGAGIVNQTIQYHGDADRYTLNGATAIATLYSNATAATTNPAVTIRSVGSNGGQAAAFTFDLARSIVYTRQGNPNWAGQNRDGEQGPHRSNDLFFGNAAGDPQTDWVNLNKVAIPQADEQQRLLANMIGQMNLDNLPLPRFWYFPRDHRAVVVMTGDDHGVGGTTQHFNYMLSVSPANCDVAEWECIRGSSYVYPDTPLDLQQAEAFHAAGFELGVHPDTGCANWANINALRTVFTNDLNAWRSNFGSLPTQVSNRTHCIAWSDWASQPIVQLENGIRLDTNYYYWPGSWVNNRPGMFTGSGIPMRFANLDGTIIDVYQAATQVADETFNDNAATIRAQMAALIANAQGPQGYYGAFTANMHTDRALAMMQGIVAEAQENNVPVINGRQLLQWLDLRNASSFGNLEWNNGTNTLTFSISTGSGANWLRAMVPVQSASANLTGLTRNGNNVTYTTRTIKGVQYAFFDGTPGSYAASYGSDTTAPTVINRNPAPNATNVPLDSNIRVTFSEAMEPSSINASSFTLRVLGGEPLQMDLSYDSGSNSVTLFPSVNFTPGTTYQAQLTTAVTDAAGNPLASAVTWTFTANTPAPTLADTTADDFYAGTGGTCAVVNVGNGAVSLAAGINEGFSTLPANWTSTPWTGGTSTASNGTLTVDGARFALDTSYGPGRSVEFLATFGAATFQHVGFGQLLAEVNGEYWAMFSTADTTNQLFARTNVNGQTNDFPIPGSWIGTVHLYRVQWNATNIQFYIDGVLVHTANVTINQNMRPLASDFTNGGPVLSVNFVSFSPPYASPCTFTSRVLDATEVVNWSTADWTSQLPNGTSLAISVRTGNTATPNGTWSNFTAVTNGGQVPGSSRYLQYQAVLTSTNADQTPLLEQIAFTTSNGGDTTPPTVLNRAPAPNGTNVALNSNVTVEFSEAMDAATITASSVTLKVQGGATVAANVTYNAGTNTATLNPNADLTAGTVYEAQVTTAVTDAAGNALAAPSTWTFTTIPPEEPCPCSIWDEPTNGVSFGSDDVPYELGVKFRSSEAGYITHLRFYWFPQMTPPQGGYLGRLWSINGTELAEVNYPTPTGSAGWRQVELPTPVQITANTVYIASYSVGNNGYAFNGAYFATNGVINSPLEALSGDAAAAFGGGRNGVYNETPGQFPTQSFNDSNYWADVVFVQNIVDTTPPTILNRVPAPNATDVAADSNVIVTFSEAMNAATITGSSITLKVQGGATVPAAVTYNAATNTATLNPNANLTAGTVYEAQVTTAVEDLAGNNLATAAVWTFTTTSPNLIDTTVADFSAGTVNACTVANLGNGAVILTPTVNTEFGGNSLPAGFITRPEPWNSGGTATISGGLLTLNGQRVTTTDFYGPGRSVEFVATLTNASFQYAGFGQTGETQQGENWAFIGTGNNANELRARVNVNGTTQDIPIPGSWFGTANRYRIDWLANSIVFSINGTVVETVNVTITADMRPFISDFDTDGSAITVDWLRMTPYASPCTFVSRVLDAGEVVDWSTVNWQAQLPTGTSITLSVRTGNTATPSGTWSNLAAVTNGGAVPGISRYLQYQAVLTSTNADQTPVLEQVAFTYGAAETTPPVITNLNTVLNPDGTAATITWNTNEPSTSVVEYGVEPNTLTLNSSSTTLVTTHSRTLTGLTPGTTYYYRAISLDEATNSANTAVASFTTPNPNVCATSVRIMPLGDSITQGAGSGVSTLASQVGYRKALYELLVTGGYNVDFVGSRTNGEAFPGFDANHESYPGQSDTFIADNIYGWLQDNPADIILLHIGTNFLDSSPTDVEEILNEVDRWETTNNRPVTVLLARIIDWAPTNPTVTAFNDNVVAMAQARTNDNIVIVDLQNGAGLNYTLGADMFDQVHPTPSGYQKMAQAWYTALTPLLSPCEAALVSTPTNPSVSSNATFTFTGTSPTFECAIDGGSFEACTSPKTYTNLSDGSHTFELRAPGSTPVSYTWTINTTPQEVCINAGGEQLVVGGRTFLSDRFFNGGSEGFRPDNIQGTGDDALYQTERWGDPFSYNIPLANGRYTVTLYFAEIIGVTGAGERVFDVDLLDRPASPDIDDLDLAVVAGPLTAYNRTFSVLISDNLLDIVFDASADDAQIGALCATPDTNPEDTTPPDTEITSNPGAVITVPEASFAFTGTDNLTAAADLLFECKLGSGSYTACNSPRLYTNLLNGDTTFSVRSVDIAGNVDPTPATFNFSVEVPPSPICINAGGDAYTAVDGTVFLADQYFTFGNVGSTGNSIAGTVDDALYQTERWGDFFNNTFSYNIPLVNGNYAVTLYFAEIAPVGPGGRIFDVNILDIGGATPELDNIDLPLVAGNNTAYNRRFLVPISDGVLNIVFNNGSAGAAQIAALCAQPDNTPPDTVITSSPAPVSTETSATFVFAAQDNLTPAVGDATFECRLDNGNFEPCTSPKTYNNLAYTSHTFEVRATDTAGNIDPTPASYTWTINEPQPQQVCINAGGPAFTTAGGINFLADQYFTDSPTYGVDSPIAGTVDDVLYQTERWGDPFGYNVPLVNGNYIVTLYFAEIAGVGPGVRVFDVDILDRPGSPEINNLDLAATVGNDTAYNRSFAAAVSDGTLNIVFDASVANAQVAALCATPSTTPDDTAPDTTITSETTQLTSATFSFTGQDNVTAAADLAFECRLNNGEFTPCSSPKTYTNLDANFTFAVRAVDGSGNSDPTPAAFTAQPRAVCINAGGGEYTTTSGLFFQADQYFTNFNTFSTAASIAGTEDDPLYQTERWGDFNYNIPAVNGDYVVTLYFAEIAGAAPGGRIFDVDLLDIPGANPEIDDLNLPLVAGNNTAYNRRFLVSITDGEFNLDFSPAGPGAPQIGALCLQPQTDVPVLTQIGNRQVNETEALTFTASATDTVVPTGGFIFSLGAGAPTGATINASTGDFSWTPTEAQGGSIYEITVIVSDGSLTDSETFSVTVNEVENAPVLATIADVVMDEDDPNETRTAAANDADGDSVTLTATLENGDPLPGFISFVDNGDNTGTFIINPDFTSSGTFSVKVTATDDGPTALTGTTTFNVTINEVDRPPVLTTIGDKTVLENATL
ncbi:MAG: malectin domain-containing carbohydrate-binding protein, partial [bacterium]|nr:malectin domain-containing carbohydrate-binding protein [bacterium]